MGNANNHQGAAPRISANMGGPPPVNTEMDDHHVRAAFRSLADRDSLLDKPNFDKALQVAEDLGFSRLQGTPISDRLFNYLDNGSKRLNEETFARGMSVLIKGSPDEKSELTFRIYDVSKHGYVEKGEMTSFFVSSWLSAWTTVGDALQSFRDSSVNSPSKEQLAKVAQNSVNDVIAEVHRLFDKHDSTKSGKLSRADFENWVRENVDIVINVGSYKWPFAMKFADTFYANYTGPPRFEG